MKITSITKDQEAKFGEWTKKWIDIGLSTEPADFDAATEAALRAYKLCKLERPMVILRMGSPYAATLGGAFAWGMLRDIEKVKDQMESEVGAQAWHQVWRQVESQVESQVGSQVVSQVWDQVWRQVESQVESQVERQVRIQVGRQVESQVGSAVNNCRGGQLWSAGWIAYVSFFRDVIGWDDPVLDLFSIDEALAKNCGWVWWHENILAISDRPSVINLDEAGRLHCENGPSIAYRDGWSLYHWHGVSIPREWIDDKKNLTAQTALTWQNIEQRRAACEIIGWAKVLKELDAKVIDSDSDPEIGTLLEVNLPDSDRERFIHVRCGTGREFALPVPKDCGDTALAANAWTYGLSADVYRPEVRT